MQPSPVKMNQKHNKLSCIYFHKGVLKAYVQLRQRKGHMIITGGVGWGGGADNLKSFFVRTLNSSKMVNFLKIVEI